ncbi:MAG: hypothetical protein RL076_2315 [Chloroflexota bacterium]|jgi:hypothetical protein
MPRCVGVAWYDAHKQSRWECDMVRRLLSGLGVVEIIVIVVVLAGVVVAIRQILQ